ncbi:NAD(P)-dependent oxidoreductase [Aspergillus tanneri]|nr:uncharacterized protein ATNIH1004_008161 [Aspergillus tanneri]KAA8643965.1 hypothetical protein ATNIH1004_008161 [Aspergillus tanneri]
MGQAMTANLVRFGNMEAPLTLYNRTKRKADEHSVKLGSCKVAQTIEEAVSNSDIVWSCLENHEAVMHTFESILSVDIKGKLFVDSSTIPPEKTNAIAERVLSAGGEFVAMPVMGEPTMAATRSLICIPSGNPASVDRIRPYLEGVVCRSVVDLSGEELGTSSLLKLMGNFLIMATMETVAEVNVLAEKTGLGTKNMSKLMNVMFPNPPHAVYNRRMVSGEYHTGVPMVEVHKAISLTESVLDMARKCGASVKLYEIAHEHLKAVEAFAGPTADITGIYGATRQESGLPYENGTQ